MSPSLLVGGMAESEEEILIWESRVVVEVDFVWDRVVFIAFEVEDESNDVSNVEVLDKIGLVIIVVDIVAVGTIVGIVFVGTVVSIVVWEVFVEGFSVFGGSVSMKK